MCGIAGLVGRSDRDKAVAVRKMLRSLERRGPDGEGIEVWGEAVLGHRPLAIIDLSDAGRQPMLSADGRVGVTFNGEVYNFIKLRKELIGRGYRFNSGTDTEVFIHGQMKAILRELARRKIGEQVARGRKRGFGIPVQRWIIGR